MVIKLDFSGADPQKKRTRTISRILLWTLRVCLILQFIFFCSTNTSRFANPELTLLDKPTTLLTYNISSTNTALPPWSSSQFSNTELTLYEKPSSLLTYNNTDFSSSEIHLDIGVPLAYNDERLVNTLCQSLGQAIGDYRNNNTRSVSFRLLVTRYANETTSEEFRLFLASKARLSKQDSVMFVPMSGKFNRAPALNGLFQAACELENCLFAGMDVDMQIQSSFIEHSIEYVMRSPDSRNGTIYFPIVWSAFEPKGVLVAEKIFGYLDTFSEHRGLWRETGHGMFVFQGPFTKILQMDEGFEGWGGEDCDFQNRTTKMGMRVVREHEPGLVHQWHEKSCIVGKDVTKRQLDACKTSAKTMEGTTFIRKLKQGKTFFQHLVDLPINSNNNTKRTTKQRSGKEARKWLSTMQSSFFNQTHAPDKDEPPKILIGVTTSRRGIVPRGSAIMKTWAKNLPPNIVVKFFLGELDSDLPSLSTGEISSLASQAGIPDPANSIVVMKGIRDDESPLVTKASAVLKHMNEFVKAHGDFEWIVDIYDGAYVNIESLVDFLQGKVSKDMQYLGRRSRGPPKLREELRRIGLIRPYCMGGPGFVLSEPALGVLAGSIDKCEEEARTKDGPLFGDAIIGVCMSKLLSIGCWDGKDYDPDVFLDLHNPQKHLDDDKLLKAVTLHHLEKSDKMSVLHNRYKVINA